ncbi:MAG: zinc-dependent alcohol dehydrogenase family protein [Candidatus Latescibacterota bacterium]
MQAVVIEKPGQLRVGRVEDPIPGPGEILIAVKAAGLCGTDVHIYEGGFTCTYPLIPGHEFAGEVIDVGSEVTTLSMGERVAVDPNVPCGVCFFCQRNQQHFCRNLKGYGVLDLPGGFAERVAVRAADAYPIGELSYEEGALIEPLGCVLHGIELIGVQPGDEVLIFGMGPIGLLLAQVCRLGGASRVVGVDRIRQNLDLAERLGLDQSTLSTQDVEETIREADPLGFDVVIDATGASGVVESLPAFTRDGGKILYFGVCPRQCPIRLDPFDVFRRELKIFGSFSLLANFDRAIRIAESGRMDLKAIISHRFALDEFDRALQLKMGEAPARKIIIQP